MLLAPPTDIISNTIQIEPCKTADIISSTIQI